MKDNKNKELIRKEILYKRDSINEQIKKDKDRKIKERLLSLFEFKLSNKILLYASFRSEVGTFDLLKYCITHRKTVALPKVDKGHNRLKIYEIKDIKELARGYFGIPEPDVSEDRAMSVEDLNLILVPAVAFDEYCNRLGYGKGFYDKLLQVVKDKELKIDIIGLAYEEQIVELIPSEPHDIRMDKIITDKRIIECHAQ